MLKSKLYEVTCEKTKQNKTPNHKTHTKQKTEESPHLSSLALPLSLTAYSYSC